MDLAAVKDEVAVFDGVFIIRERVLRLAILPKRDDHLAPIIFGVDRSVRLFAVQYAVEGLIDLAHELPVGRGPVEVRIDVERHPIGMLGDMVIFERNFIIILDIQVRLEPRPAVHIPAASAQGHEEQRK